MNDRMTVNVALGVIDNFKMSYYKQQNRKKCNFFCGQLFFIFTPVEVIIFVKLQIFGLANQNLFYYQIDKTWRKRQRML